MKYLNTSIRIQEITARAFVLTLFIITGVTLYGQSERSEIRSGNRAYKQGHFQKSEIDYRRALQENQNSLRAKYNLSNALYKLNKGEEAVNTILPAVDSIDNQGLKSGTFHNIGNYYLSQKKYSESVEAYKNSLRINPSDMDTKANLAYAQKMLKDQQDKQNQQDMQKDQDKKDDNKDQQDKNQQNNDDKQQEKEQKEQPQITPQAAQQMLQAIQNKEKETQEKVKREKAKVMQGKTKEKNW